VGVDALNGIDSDSPRELSELKVKIFADGADLASMLSLYRNPLIKGFTTNPTLMRKCGIADYRGFAQEVVDAIPDRPVSFEVFADEFDEMRRQAEEIAAWGANVYVKIPITNTRRETAVPLIRQLADEGVKLNITAMMTLRQVEDVCEAVMNGPSSYVSVFAGRVADTGRDPLPIMAEAVRIARPNPRAEIIWASPRELLNIYHAEQVGCQIITVTHDILKKMALIGKDLDDYSLETVTMFHRDGQSAGYSL